MKKEPSKKQIATLLLSGLGILSFGLLLIWIPFVGSILLITGAFLTLISLASIGLKVVNKVIK